MNDRESIIAHLRAEEAKFVAALLAEHDKAAPHHAILERLGASASLCRTLAAYYERKDDRAGQEPEAKVPRCQRNFIDGSMNRVQCALPDGHTPYADLHASSDGHLMVWCASPEAPLGRWTDQQHIDASEPAPTRITTGCLVSWPGSGGVWAALEDSAPDPRGTGRLVFRAMHHKTLRVMEVCPPLQCDVENGNLDDLSRRELTARNTLNPPPRDRSKPAKTQE